MRLIITIIFYLFESCLQSLSALVLRSNPFIYFMQSLEPSLIFCGDFNASFMAAVHEFLLARNVHPNHPDWATGRFSSLIELKLSNILRHHSK